MKRFSIFFVLALALVFSTSYSAGKKKTETNKKAVASKPIKGYIANLNDILSGGTGRVTKEKALEYVANGYPIVLATGEGKSLKIYFVLNTDGSFAGKKIANYAVFKSVGVLGKVKVVSGLNMIIAEKIDSIN